MHIQKTYKFINDLEEDVCLYITGFLVEYLQSEDICKRVFTIILKSYLNF